MGPIHTHRKHPGVMAGPYRAGVSLLWRNCRS